ncbi:hypothetical protein [Adhaeribacter pallidiroseus]|uniref:Uncharacterized protein n=1 Tax=Adhaeribacter pallidiroseus TaxID=2072847 RepID=A0A369QJC9_9BACT|nr:hypothetical protein [Adhaeribacter pallidiroseus]RDC64410.1 hypothetical protein AHMF7616_03024 [Adhaeribacter pallidiroseus]
MKAEQAKSIADEAIRLANEAELKELEPLFNDIKEAASTGKTSITVEALSPLARKQLSKNGYTVRASNQTTESYTIDWANPQDSTN